MKLILVAVTLIFLFAACGSNDVDDPTESTPSTPSTPTTLGTLRLFLTDQPVDLKQVWVTITDIEVHKTGGTWIHFAASGDSIDLLTLEGRQTLLEAAPLEQGKYTGIRFFVSEGHIIDADDERCELKVPSGKIHIPVDFNIEEGSETSILLDFDAEKSVHVVRTGKKEHCNLRPVIHPVSVNGS
jgi:Domain of unknown function (DUF4382)